MSWPPAIMRAPGTPNYISSTLLGLPTTATFHMQTQQGYLEPGIDCTSPEWLRLQHEEAISQRLVAKRPRESFVSIERCIPETDHKHYRWHKSHLLSLPKEIRLEIWKCVFSSPLTVKIDRQVFHPSYRMACSPFPKLSFSHIKRHEPISTGLITTNKLLHEEALPFLYRHAKFMPSDLEGLLPVFLDALAPCTQSYIRTIRLNLPLQAFTKGFTSDRSKPFFHWAVTCAQVAQLNNTLQLLEIVGDWDMIQDKRNKRAILNPLCKLKAQKKFIAYMASGDHTSAHDEQFRELLREAERDLEANAKIREEYTKADAAERSQRNKILQEQQEQARQARLRNNSKPLDNSATIDHIQPLSVLQYDLMHSSLEQVERDLSTVSGIAQFERELEEHSGTQENNLHVSLSDPFLSEEWDMVCMGSGASTPEARPDSVLSKDSVASWTDTASTIVGKEDDVSIDGEDWELISRVP